LPRGCETREPCRRVPDQANALRAPRLRRAEAAPASRGPSLALVWRCLGTALPARPSESLAQPTPDACRPCVCLTKDGLRQNRKACREWAQPERANAGTSPHLAGPAMVPPRRSKTSDHLTSSTPSRRVRCRCERVAKKKPRADRAGRASANYGLARRRHENTLPAESRPARICASAQRRRRLTKSCRPCGCLAIRRDEATQEDA
jgi:hypothetical protein